MILRSLLSMITFGIIPEAPKKPQVLTGFASYYSRDYVGKTMANGQPYNPRACTIACNDIPLGKTVYVRYQTPAGNWRSVHCTVTDRGPADHLRRTGRIFDLSWAAFNVLENPRKGVIAVEVQVLD